MDKQITAIRKSFDQLTPNEYEHYFYVVRLLLIFAPDKQDARQYSFLRKGGYNIKEQIPVTPKCMYDVFISIHASCCEHNSQFFPYWHRWLLIKYEQYLLKAHKAVLSSTLVKDQADRLLELAHKVNPKTTKKEIQDLLVAIQKAYQGVIGNQTISYIPAHYWNVFQLNQEIYYPKGYINKEAYSPDSYDNIDKLIRLIWDQDSIYEINFTTRYNMKEFGYGIKRKPQLYQQHQQLLNNTDFWAAPEKYPPEYIQKASKFIEFQADFLTYQQYLKRRVSQNDGQNLNKVYFNVLDRQSVNYIFGGKGYSYYPDITQPPPSINLNPRNPTRLKNKRNDNIGYYSYCRSLCTKPQDFMYKFTTGANGSSQFSMQNPHNSMHNNQQYCMNDPSFSVTNPIFFAYHSLIDLMLEYKIDQLKGNITNQSKAANSIQKYFNEDLKNHGTDQYNFSFKENWKSDQKNNHSKIVKNSDYPVLKWVSPGVRQNKKGFSDNDYAVVQDYTYTKIILDQPNTLRNLSNLIPETTLSYDRLAFDKVIQQIQPHVKNPYSPSNLYVALQIRHRSTIQSTNLNIELKNMNGQVLTTKTYPIFSQGERAGKCPNCTQFKTNKILFPVEQLKEHFDNLIDIRKNGRFEESAFSQVESRVNIASSLSYHLSSEHVTARFVTGRQNLNILVKNIDKDVKVYLKTEEKQISNSRAIERRRIREPLIFNAIDGNDKKKVEASDVNIIGAQAQLNGKTINYNFQFYSEESEIVFDFGKHEDKIGLSKTPCIGQTLNNVYELTTESTVQSKKQIVEERAEEKVKTKFEKITLSYKDFE